MNELSLWSKAFIQTPNSTSKCSDVNTIKTTKFHTHTLWVRQNYTHKLIYTSRYLVCTRAFVGIQLSTGRVNDIKCNTSMQQKTKEHANHSRRQLVLLPGSSCPKFPPECRDHLWGIFSTAALYRQEQTPKRVHADDDLSRLSWSATEFWLLLVAKTIRK